MRLHLAMYNIEIQESGAFSILTLKICLKV